MRLTRLLLMAKAAKPKPKGKDPSQNWERHFSGMTWGELKKHYAIIPIYGMTIFAMGMAGAYVLRLATRHPEVSWTKKNPEPWEEYKNKQYKFVSSGRDYSKSSTAPPYDK